MASFVSIGFFPTPLFAPTTSTQRVKCCDKEGTTWRNSSAFLKCFLCAIPSNILSARITGEEMCCTSNMGRLSSHATLLKVPELLASCSSSRGMPSVNQWHRDHSAIPSRNLGDAICCCFGVDSCTDRVIAGFWVGPDIDDGWGYVEAFINQIL